MGANKKPAEIQKEEWIAGCHKLQIDSIDKFKKLLPSLDTGFMDREDFNDFYKVCVYLFWIDWGGGVVFLVYMYVYECISNPNPQCYLVNTNPPWNDMDTLRHLLHCMMRGYIVLLPIQSSGDTQNSRKGLSSWTTQNVFDGRTYHGSSS